MINRKAKFEYHILEEYKAGIVLFGPEVKSIRAGNASIDEAYCLVVNGEIYIRNMYIKPYDNALDNSEPRRDRKLLLSKKEINKIEKTLIDKGLTIVPLHTLEKGFIKIVVGIAKGKKLFDKRQTIKDRDSDRELAKMKI